MAASIFEDGTHTVSLPELSRRWTKGGRGEKLRKRNYENEDEEKMDKGRRNSRGMLKGRFQKRFREGIQKKN